MYEELVKQLRASEEYGGDDAYMIEQAADAIEELMKAAKAMHTWIFLNSGDEQAAYDECGLSDEMNAMLGYGGQFVVEPPKEETE